MPASSNIMWSSARSEAALEAALPVAIEIRPLRTAKRLRLRFDETSGMLRLTCPWRTNRRAALAWALDQRGWIEAQLARTEPAELFEAGATIPLEGREVLIVWDALAPRTPVFRESKLCVGGPETGLARRVELFLKRRALETMSGEVAEFCAAAGVIAASVGIGAAG